MAEWIGHPGCKRTRALSTTPFATHAPTSARALTSLVLAGTLAAAALPAEARSFTDSAGRTVDLPAEMKAVYPSGHPASILLYTLAPDTLLGWTRDLPSDLDGLMPDRYRDLPVIGRLGGRGDTANLERVLALSPDAIFDYGAVREPYTSMADRLQAQIGIPNVLLDGRFGSLAHSYLKLGEMLGRMDRARTLAAYARETLDMARRIRESVPEGARPSVYYGRESDGLTTAFEGSLNAEILDLVGARNVATGVDEPGLGSIGLEQVLAWNPEVILTINETFYDSLRQADPVWSRVKAVANGQVYLAPERPFGWFDRPPSVNRLIGVRWLLHLFYPERMHGNLRDEVRRFYQLFYHVEPSPAQLDRLLGRAMP